LQRCRHIRELKGNRLVLNDGSSERSTPFRVGKSSIKCGPGHSDRLSGNAKTAKLETGQSDFQSLPFVTDQLIRAHLTILERDLAVIAGSRAHSVLDARNQIARRPGRNDES